MLSAEGLWPHLRAKLSVLIEAAPEKSDAATQTELVTKEMSVQLVASNGCPDSSPGEKAGACTKCAQVDDVLSDGSITRHR